MDQNKKGYITEEDVTALFNQLKIQYSNQQIDLFIKKYLDTRKEDQKVCTYKHFI